MGENYITCQEQLGSINISEDVIYSMVRTASIVSGGSGFEQTAVTASSDTPPVRRMNLIRFISRTLLHLSVSRMWRLSRQIQCSVSDGCCC